MNTWFIISTAVLFNFYRICTAALVKEDLISENNAGTRQISEEDVDHIASGTAPVQGDPEVDMTSKIKKIYELVDPPTELNMIYGDKKDDQDDEGSSPFKMTLENSELRLKISTLERARITANAKMAALRSEIEEMKRGLNRTTEELITEQEANRIMKNTNSALNLENQQAMNNVQKEQIKIRRLIAELDLIAEKTNNSLSKDPSTNKSNSWDVHETVWNGQNWLQNWDGREPKNGDGNTSATRVLFFLRHGHYEYSLPEEGIEMSELGKMQMDWTGRGLGMLKYHWHKIFVHSSKRRTQQAAEIVAKYIPGLILQPSDLIWSCPNENDSLRRQEAFKEFIHRAEPSQKRTSYELIVTHSSIIRYFVERALQVPAETLSLPLVHGSITRIEIQGDGRVVLREFGEYSHLPRNLITSSNAKWFNHDPLFVNWNSTVKPPVTTTGPPAG